MRRQQRLDHWRVRVDIGQCFDNVGEHRPGDFNTIASLVPMVRATSSAAMPVASAICAIDVESNPCCANRVNATSIGS